MYFLSTHSYEITSGSIPAKEECKSRNKEMWDIGDRGFSQDDSGGSAGCSWDHGPRAGKWGTRFSNRDARGKKREQKVE